MCVPVLTFDNFKKPTGFKTITVYNNKGGVGKTTLCCNLADKLSSKGYRVLLIDADVQLNSTLIFFDRLKARSDKTVDFETYWTDMDMPYAEMVKGDKHIQGERITFYNQFELVMNEGFSERNQLRDPIKIMPNLDLIPGDMRMFYINDELQNYIEKANKEQMRKMRTMLTAYGQDGYDFVLIDMSPASDFLNQTLWFSSDYIIMPATYDRYSKIALPNLSKWIERIWLQKHKFWIDNPDPKPKEGRRPKVIAVTCTGFKKYGGEISLSHQVDSESMGTKLKEFCGAMRKHNMLASALFNDIKPWYDSHILNALSNAKAKIGDNIMESLSADLSALAGIPILEIRDYSKMMLVFQNCYKPVYALSSKDLKTVRATLDLTYKLHREEANLMFELLAYLVVRMSDLDGTFEYRSAADEEEYWRDRVPVPTPKTSQPKKEKARKTKKQKL